MASGTRFAVPLAVVATFLAASLPAAAQNEFETTAITLRDPDDGAVLATAAVQEIVEVVATVEYTGAASNDPGPIAVQLTIRTSAGSVSHSDAASVTPDRSGSGSTTEAVFDWRPTSVGTYNVGVSIPSAATTSNKSVTVAETAARAGDLADRLVDYWYVVFGFAASVVLFLVMASARRSP